MSKCKMVPASQVLIKGWKWQGFWGGCPSAMHANINGLLEDGEEEHVSNFLLKASRHHSCQTAPSEVSLTIFHQDRQPGPCHRLGLRRRSTTWKKVQQNSKPKQCRNTPTTQGPPATHAPLGPTATPMLQQHLYSSIICTAVFNHLSKAATNVPRNDVSQH